MEEEKSFTEDIMYEEHNVDLLKYCVTPYHPDIPEPTGLSIFIKGLAELEIDKSLIVNGHVLSVLAHKWSRRDTQSDADATCNGCNKDIHISHLSTCPVCTWTDFYPNCTRCRCMICDFQVSKGDFTHVIASCPHCRRGETAKVIFDQLTA